MRREFTTDKIQIGQFIHKTILILTGYFIFLVILKIYNKRTFIHILQIILCSILFKKMYINMSQVISHCFYKRLPNFGEDFRGI